MSDRRFRRATYLPMAVPVLAALAIAHAGAHSAGAQPVGAAAVQVAATPTTRPAGTPAATPAARPDARKAAALPVVSVHKSPTCGCCGLWVEHMREAGFTVQVHETDDLQPIKQRLGVPRSHASCHTAQVGPYFVEGHVPAEAVRRLLAQRPDARGIAVPGMPMGSPGMEVPSGQVQSYTVDLVGKDGATSEFARYGR